MRVISGDAHHVGHHIRASHVLRRAAYGWDVIRHRVSDVLFGVIGMVAAVVYRSRELRIFIQTIDYPMRDDLRPGPEIWAVGWRLLALVLFVLPGIFLIDYVSSVLGIKPVSEIQLPLTDRSFDQTAILGGVSFIIGFLVPVLLAGYLRYVFVDCAPNLFLTRIKPRILPVLAAMDSTPGWRRQTRLIAAGYQLAFGAMLAAWSTMALLNGLSITSPPGPGDFWRLMTGREWPAYGADMVVILMIALVVIAFGIRRLTRRDDGASPPPARSHTSTFPPSTTI